MHLVDPVALHVEQAPQVTGSAPAAFTAAAGDARQLAEPDESQDAVLLFGPLYHLTGQAERRLAPSEARRVLRPGSRLLTMAVCRFASLLDGLPEFFTTAYFHTPGSLASEISQAGFTGPAIYGV